MPSATTNNNLHIFFAIFPPSHNNFKWLHEMFQQRKVFGFVSALLQVSNTFFQCFGQCQWPIPFLSKFSLHKIIQRKNNMVNTCHPKPPTKTINFSNQNQQKQNAWIHHWPNKPACFWYIEQNRKNMSKNHQNAIFNFWLLRCQNVPCCSFDT